MNGCRLVKLMVVGLLALSIGLHWALLQSVAWAGMFLHYAQQSSVADALVKTFDGQHPCKICRIVEKGRKAEKPQDSKETKSPRHDLCLSSSDRFDFPSAPQPSVAGIPGVIEVEPPAPPRPPPRVS